MSKKNIKIKNKYSLIAENTSDVVCLLDKNLHLLYISPSSKRLFGYTQEDFEDKTLLFMVHPEDKQLLLNELQNANFSRGKNEWRSTFRIYKKTGELCWIEATVNGVYDAQGNLDKFVTVHRDVSTQKELEGKLQESEQRFRTLVESSRDIFLIMDENLRIEYMNPYYRDLGGCSIDNMETLEDLLRRVHPDDRERVEQEIAIGYETKAVHGHSEFRIYTTENNIIWVHSITTANWNAEGNLAKAFVYIRDITEYKNLEFQLRAAIEEKQILMNELNHRVKNNLYLVSSLIRLKDHGLGDKGNLSDLYNQVTAIQTVHELLQESDTVTKIPIHFYIEKLLSGILAQQSALSIKVVKKLEEIELPSQIATSVGMIISELTLNAIKHGMDTTTEPRIELKLERTGNGEECVLEFAQTGKPFPEDISLDNSNTLGLRLISASIKQIDGTIELVRSPYPVFTIRFPYRN